MSSGLEIDRDSVERHATAMRVHGEDYAAALERLRERGVAGASWGGAGGLLSMLLGPYAEATALGLEAMTGISGAMGDTGNGLSLASANTREGERAGVDQARALADRWT
ncbi:hypothetical protein ACQEVF_35530 [Nonomuraea polychroma]|uniref:hypothetical protein n=1 Tax=Nonomuraea polychroma TaxID=46176 RepID=UPI003D902343